ncbi:MAG TPA: CotH kinase family protein [Flavipsychrobacter sp.]|nr:CotH kinase family protein [Flavipsychrobacter sp.]
MRSVIGILVLLFCCGFLQAQTFNGIGGSIPDDGSTNAYFTINVSGLSPSGLTAAKGLKSVCLNLTHAYDADLQIVLKAPDGTEVTLANTAGGSGNNFTNTCFEQTASTFINFATAPFSGTYRPGGHLGYINNGQNGNGAWTLRILDNSPGDQGSLVSWTLNFASNAPVTAAITSSDLPIVMINTNNKSIPDDPKIAATMGIIYKGAGITNLTTDPFNNYNGNIAIETRGSSSQQFPKKSFGFETQDVNGDDTDASLLNMPAQSDWILYASYSDKSLLNNVLAYTLYNNFGMYAPRTAFVELFINKQYQGVYVLMEKIKRDVNRVDISKMTTADTAGDALTGGYIIKIDKTTGGNGDGWDSKIDPPVHPNGQKIAYQYEYPKPEDIMPKQKAYIEKFVDSFELALDTKSLYDTNTGWRKYGAEPSFLRYFILNELAKNVDGYRISTFLYKTKNTKGNKLFVGPPWDYDIAFHNADYCDADIDTGWSYQFGINSCSTDDHQVAFWWSKFMQDTVFKNNLKCMYSQLRTTVLDTVWLFHYIDSCATVLSAPQTRNFSLWPIIGKYVWPNPSPVPNSYAGEITELKQYLKRRLAWLDANIPGSCAQNPTSVQSISDRSVTCKLFPNPFSNELHLQFYAEDSEPLQVTLSAIDGRKISAMSLQIKPGYNDVLIFDSLTTGLSTGMYLVSVTQSGKVSNFKVWKM